MSRIVVVIGATGGLGTAIAQAFIDLNAQVVLVGRNADRLYALAESLGGLAMPMTADITAPDDLNAVSQACRERFGRVDVVINAAGYDVRAPFADHKPDEIRRLLDINLLGAIWVTRAFMPVMLTQQSGVLLHLGGFADGRLAFPYYTVDSASRAGLRGFVDAVNREHEGSGVTVTFFCPAPSDTEAERPYHPIWREMGMVIATPEQVAQAVILAVNRRQRVSIMGVSTRLFAWLNSLSSSLADALLMRRYRVILKRFLTHYTP
jgi:NADP-dependent 3-hydroxy acid dehydrogenase YdfG